jgi:hypothetical protein
MIRKILASISVTLAIISFFNCKTKNIKDTENKEIVMQYKNILKEILSPDKSKILILEYVDKMEIPILFKYKVLDSTSKKELISGIFSGVKMEWEDDTSIRAHSYIAIVEKDNQHPEKLYKLIKVE